MNTLRRFAALASAAAMAVLTLTGCSSNNIGGAVGDAIDDIVSPSQNESITLTVWESTGGPDDFIRKAGERYTAEHPNIQIKFVNVEVGDATSQIALDGPAGVGPDVFAAPHDKLGELVTGEHILPTSNPDSVRDSVLDVCADAVTYNGTMYGYPIAAETYALVYNKKYVTDPPKTFDEVVDFCKGYNGGGKYGLMFDVSNAYYTIIFTTNDKNRLFGDTGTDSANPGVNTDAAIAGMTYFQSLRKKILDVPAADLNTATVDEAFKSGVSAMHITGPWNIATFADAGIDFGVTSIPALPGQDTPPASFSGTRTMFVSSYSAHPDEAADFARFLISDEMQQLRFELTGAIPSASITVDSERVNGFLKQLEHSFSMPSVPQMSKFWDAMNSASANIWDGADVKNELDSCEKAILSA